MRYFELKRENEERWRDNDGSDFDEEKYYSCPITYKPVNPNWSKPN
eukprot:CAMPEP_0185588258 /NCGR_PEP_ID=MMETSP0434-20130131/52335_1 /TAXON_ID=626734 ORGANISM="Favella taraikaensis, Strain Fe Narragansett Bay" /NCGR_SAMPLE_ID=MMETSP0434 /ASSEMBLY_ACC=CAM_ASM_000379 /LENGTH=45 /DNA_ID= /DNA_START= /DNA_END= /DNA_ORIENTATION=